MIDHEHDIPTDPEQGLESGKVAVEKPSGVEAVAPLGQDIPLESIIMGNDPDQSTQVGDSVRQEPEEKPQYIAGWRLHMLTIGTSLVSITNALDGFELRDWIVTAYLITYTGI
ncbi:hypothetical protein LSUE1_G005573 [Lachnellula suecica]|uniref:Uncharacterized protein n=1 Tax=Lachnellula suecica TaxID=602035 RepID=A0A8T9C2J0_9HELO|nr:hypothetical protein LSUE1_G005573 [Lachnellula suecica]